MYCGVKIYQIKSHSVSQLTFKWQNIFIGFTFAFGQLFTNLSMAYISIGLTYVIKILEPLFAICGTILLFKEIPSLAVLIYTCGIMLGVCLVVIKDCSHNSEGIVYALLSNLFLASRNTGIKYINKQTSVQCKGNFSTVHKLEDFSIISMIASLFMLGLLLIAQCTWVECFEYFTYGQLYAVASCFLGQHIFSYLVLGEVSVLGHALANSLKRLLVIFVSSLVMRTALTSIQELGVMIAIYCFYLYSTTKGDGKSSMNNRKQLKTFMVSCLGFWFIIKGISWIQFENILQIPSHQISIQSDDPENGNTKLQKDLDKIPRQISCIATYSGPLSSRAIRNIERLSSELSDVQVLCGSSSCLEDLKSIPSIYPSR